MPGRVLVGVMVQLWQVTKLGEIWEGRLEKMFFIVRKGKVILSV